MVDQHWNLTVGDLRFDVLDRNIDSHRRSFVVAPRIGHGCVLMFLDPQDDPVVVIEAVKYDTQYTAEGTPPLPRKYGTRSMLLGAMHALMRLAARRYPHLREFHLADEASYPCAMLAPNARVKTFATDLLLDGRTYYERHLNVRLLHPVIAGIADRVRQRVTLHMDLTWDAFWAALVAPRPHGGDVERPPEHLAWLDGHRQALERMYARHYSREHSWRLFFQRVHARWGCRFFACCWWRLCVVFEMTRLAGAVWRVAFDDVPPLPDGASWRLTKAKARDQQGGGGKKSRLQHAHANRLHAAVMRTWFKRHGM